MVNLKKVTNENVWKIVKLSVNKEQENFVATNASSIIEAYVTTPEDGSALPFGIYDDEELIGFVMIGRFEKVIEGDPSVVLGNYCLWRLMIDAKFQHKGYGKQAMKVIMDYIETMPCGKSEYCWLSYESENQVARHLYASCGFEETGEVCDEEVVAVKKIG